MYCLNCQEETEGSTICQYCGCTEQSPSQAKIVQNKTTYKDCEINFNAMPLSETEKKRMQKLSDRHLKLVEMILHDTDMSLDKIFEAVCKVNPENLPEIPSAKRSSDSKRDDWYTKDEIKSEWDASHLEPIPIKEKSHVDTWIETAHKRDQEHEEMKSHYESVFGKLTVEQWKSPIPPQYKIATGYEQCSRCIFSHDDYCIRHNCELDHISLYCPQYHPVDYLADRQWHKDGIKEKIVWIVVSFLVGLVFIGPYLQQLGYF